MSYRRLSPREPNKYRVTATQKYTSPPRVEVIEVEALTGSKAKKFAVARNAERLGWPYVKRGRGYYNTEGWTFTVELARGTVEVSS